jgi:multiple sugar transport system permease protein
MVRKKLTPIVMLLPVLVLLVIFLVVPIVTGLAMSFQHTSFSGVSRFVGFDNYLRFVREGERFYTNLKVTLIYVTVDIILVIPMSYGAALLITRKNRFARFFRTIYLLPWITAPVVSTLMVQTLLDSQTGLVFFIMKLITKREILPLMYGGSALAVLIIHSFWRSFPYIMLFLAAGISTISDELYEAARVDGAGKIRSFFSLTLPMTMNQLGISVLMVTIWALQDSESVYALTGGGPGYSTETIAVRLFKNSFVNFDLNMGSAMGVILILLSLVFMFMYMKSLMRGDIYE